MEINTLTQAQALGISGVQLNTQSEPIQPKDTATQVTPSGDKVAISEQGRKMAAEMKKPEENTEPETKNQGQSPEQDAAQANSAQDNRRPQATSQQKNSQDNEPDDKPAEKSKSASLNTKVATSGAAASSNSKKVKFSKDLTDKKASLKTVDEKIEALKDKETPSDQDNADVQQLKAKKSTLQRDVSSLESKLAQ